MAYTFFQVNDADERQWVAGMFFPYFSSSFSADEWGAWLAKESVQVSVAMETNQEIGVVVGERVEDEGEIIELAVVPEWRRQGVGGELLHFFLNTLREQGVVNVFLEVRAGNAAARGLYAKAGFREIGVRKKYYKDGEDAIQMQLSQDDMRRAQDDY